MLIVTVQIAPHGDMRKLWTLRTMHVCNDKTGTEGHWNFTYKLFDDGDVVLKTGRVTDLERAEWNPWPVVAATLNDALEKLQASDDAAGEAEPTTQSD